MEEPASDADLMRLMSEVISLREQVAQAELHAHQLQRVDPGPVFIPSKRTRAERAR